MYFLKTSVLENAKHLVRDLPLTADNFDQVWSALTDHYENKRLLVRH